ncbi:hypothetical protein [Nonomuraea sp. NPDC003214]
MARLRLSRALKTRLANGPVRRAVDQLTDRAEQAVRDHVPDAKQWVSTQMKRPAHTDAHGQHVPENVPYRLKGKGPGWDLADRPRDPTLPAHQSIGCQCQSLPLPGAIADAVTRTSVHVDGGRVSAKVVITYPRIAESDLAEQGGGWLAAAIRAART